MDNNKISMNIEGLTVQEHSEIKALLRYQGARTSLEKAIQPAKLRDDAKPGINIQTDKAPEQPCPDCVLEAAERHVNDLLLELLGPDFKPAMPFREFTARMMAIDKEPNPEKRNAMHAQLHHDFMNAGK